MRNRFDRQLQTLNDELIEMGGLIEQAIEMACSETGCGKSGKSDQL